MATDRYVKNEATLKAQRSLFPMKRRILTSYFHGYLHPVGSPIEVLPGDTWKSKISAFTRMSTPIVPVMDNIRQEIDAFFVPKRILWNKTKQFYGEAPSFGIATPVSEPFALFNSTLFHAEVVSRLTTNIIKSESFAGAFGLIVNDSDNSNRGANIPINLLPLRAYLAVYNEYYRDENYQDQYTWNKDTTGMTNALAVLGSTNIFGISLLPQVNKDRDVVTSLLPYQIKGSPVTISIGGSAPVYVDGAEVSFGWNDQGASSGLQFMAKYSDGDYINYFKDINTQDVLATIYDPNSSRTKMGGKLYADVANATAVSVSDLIYAFAYQDFLARAAHFGTRYKEYIYGMFHTKIADATEDIPEYLGRLKFHINVNQVVQTTGFAASSSTSLGSLGAFSNSGNSGELFNKSFTEPGYIVLVTYTKHQRTYSSGIDRVFLKSELLDYYQPPFANIADVPFGSFNVWVDDATETSLGFQEPWYDYKSLMDRCYGLMNPMIDSLGEIWTLAEKWTTKPTIAGAFMIEDRAAIARVLATGVNGPDYIMDFEFSAEVARVMPISSRTGLKVM